MWMPVGVDLGRGQQNRHPGRQTSNGHGSIEVHSLIDLENHAETCVPRTGNTPERGGRSVSQRYGPGEGGSDLAGTGH